MSYAQHRKIIDADSHVIELDDFLHAVADEEHKDLIPLMSDLTPGSRCGHPPFLKLPT